VPLLQATILKVPEKFWRFPTTGLHALKVKKKQTKKNKKTTL